MLGELQPHLHAFCHLKPERSFLYEGDLQSLLCHRCTGIYSGFLIVLLIGLFMRWNGQWKGFSIKAAGVTSALLVGLSLLQVWTEDLFGLFWLTSDSSRFIVGCLTGLGLFQFNRMIHPKLENSKQTPWWFMIIFVVVFVIHLQLASKNYHYSSWVALLGATSIYFVMNFAVLQSFLEKSSRFVLSLGAIVMIALEWTMIYMVNKPS